MIRLRDRLPRYLLGKFQLTATVVFAALFSLVFMLLRLPFSNNVWMTLEVSQVLEFTLVYFLFCVSVVVISRRIMYLHGWSWHLTVAGYILWCIIEMLIITVMYSFFTAEASKLGLFPGEENIHLADNMLDSLICNAAALGIPYLIAAMYFVILQQSNTIRLMNYSSVVTDQPIRPSEEKRITLFDNSGALKFSSSLSNIYLIEADDNYVQVWYTDSAGDFKQYMIRCRLKTIEDSFADSSLVRCHRKYIVNIDKVRVLKSESTGYSIDLGMERTNAIPVSKTYEKAVIDRVNAR